MTELEKRLKDRVSSVRACAAEALSEISVTDSIAPMLRCLTDQDTRDDDRERVGIALTKYGSLAVTPLISCLNHKKSSVRRTAVVSLGRIGDNKAVLYLINCLNDEDVFVRKYSAKFLGYLGDIRALEPLQNCLDDEHEYVREHAAKAIRNIKKASSKTF